MGKKFDVYQTQSSSDLKSCGNYRRLQTKAHTSLYLPLRSYQVHPSLLG